jgi:hypothetical protein
MEMKKLLLLAVGSILVFTGCYKEQERPSATVVLAGTRWKIDRHVAISNGIVEPGAPCGIAFNLVFNEDSTGYYYYPTKCLPSDPDTLRFHWRMSFDNKNIHYSLLNGDPAGNAVVALSDYSQEFGFARLRSGTYYKRLLDGLFIADTAK